MTKMTRIRVAFLTVCSLFLLPFAHGQRVPKAHLATVPMNKNQRQLFMQSMQLFDISYDAGVHLLLHPHDGNPHVTGRYMVRESSWYALGLLMRHAPGDHDRAIHVIEAILQEQYLDHGTRWYGTFRRSPEEPSPKTGDAAFSSYDPNWRHFIGTSFELLLTEYAADLSPDLAVRLASSIHAAVEGEINDGRLLPSYSNVALMYGSLWDFAATKEHNPQWQKQSAAWNDEVFRLFRQHNTFYEFNAPTYYGVDLYGLALWREYGSSKHIRSMGVTMEATLWGSIAQFYQPSLRNMAGPYDRAYGMDMTQYVTPLGVWMRTILPAADAPLPERQTLTTYQVADMWFAPQIILLGTKIPAKEFHLLHTERTPRLVRVVIDEQRTATAWLSQCATWGGEFTGMTKDSGTQSQFHPATAHWVMPSGQIGWAKIVSSPKIDATATPEGLTITTNGDVTLRIFAGPERSTLEQKNWQLPGMHMAFETDANSFSVATPNDCNGCHDVHYAGVHTLKLKFSPSVRP